MKPETKTLRLERPCDLQWHQRPRASAQRWFSCRDGVRYEIQQDGPSRWVVRIRLRIRLLKKHVCFSRLSAQRRAQHFAQRRAQQLALRRKRRQRVRARDGAVEGA